MPTAQKLTAALLSALLGAGNASAPGDVRDQQWYLEFLGIEQAHELSTGEGVVVGVIDTGVDGGHPDLAGHLLPGADMSPLHASNALEDGNGHGTAMAGLIAASGRALGIAPGATILPVRDSEFEFTNGADSA